MPRMSGKPRKPCLRHRICMQIPQSDLKTIRYLTSISLASLQESYHTRPCSVSCGHLFSCSYSSFIPDTILSENSFFGHGTPSFFKQICESTCHCSDNSFDTSLLLICKYLQKEFISSWDHFLAEPFPAISVIARSVSFLQLPSDVS